MDSDVSLDSETRPLRGFQLLVLAGLLAAAIAVIKAAGTVLENLPSLIGALLPAVIIIGLLLVILRAAFGGSISGAMQSVGRTAGSGARRGAGFMTRAVGRGASGGVRTGVRAGSAAGAFSSTRTIRRFRVRAMTGELVSCVQPGELTGDEVRQGDYVLLDGRRTPQKHLLVRQVELLQGPNGPTMSVIRTRRDAQGVLLVLDRVATVVGGLLAVWVAIEVVRVFW